jgi:hypothetical protein
MPSTLDLYFYREFDQALGEMADGMRGMIAAGNCKDFADYRYQCGVAEGLRQARQKARETNDKLART